MKKIDILLIDDNEVYCKTLKNLAWQIGDEKGLEVEITYFQNLEDGISQLESTSKYHALILDAKSLLTKEQEVDDFDFLPMALHKLNEVNKSTGRHYIPFAVNTGYYDKFRNFDTLVKEQHGRIFDKSTQEREMIEYLFSEILNADNTKLLSLYSDVFEVFTLGYLPDIMRVNLLSILKNMDNPSQGAAVMREARVMQDAIYNALNAKSKSIVPDGLNLREKNNHLSGKIQKSRVGGKDIYNATSTVYQTPVIESLSTSIHKVASSFASHSSAKPTQVTVKYWQSPSMYAVKSLVYSLLELLLWFKAMMKM